MNKYASKAEELLGGSAQFKVGYLLPDGLFVRRDPTHGDTAHDVLQAVEGSEHTNLPIAELAGAHFVSDIPVFQRKADAIRIADYNTIDVEAPVTDEQLDTLKYAPQLKNLRYIAGDPRYTAAIKRALRLRDL